MVDFTTFTNLLAYMANNGYLTVTGQWVSFMELINAINSHI